MIFKKLIVNVLILAVALMIPVIGFADEKQYEPTWSSLDSRENPQWFHDAKFGIFIHWGLYSVPSYAPRGTYAEWYWHCLLYTSDAADE